MAPSAHELKKGLKQANSNEFTVYKITLDLLVVYLKHFDGPLLKTYQDKLLPVVLYFYELLTED